jgi:hypothetical protein
MAYDLREVRWQRPPFLQVRAQREWQSRRFAVFPRVVISIMKPSRQW